MFYMSWSTCISLVEFCAPIHFKFKLCRMPFERKKILTCWKFKREMKTKRWSKEIPNRWILSTVLFSIYDLFAYNMQSAPKLATCTVFIGRRLSLGYTFDFLQKIFILPNFHLYAFYWVHCWPCLIINLRIYYSYKYILVLSCY